MCLLKGNEGLEIAYLGKAYFFFFFFFFTHCTLPAGKRIWPFGDLFGVFSDEVILAEDEQRTVDGEAILPHGDGVVQCHRPRSLRHGLLVHSLGPGPTGWTVSVGAVPVSVAVAMSVDSSLPAAATAARTPSAGPSAVPGRHLISEARHSLDAESQSSRSSAEGDQCSAVRPHNITSHLDRDVL